jgi:hypothetical protein
MQPQTRYARSGDVHIAYQVLGDGPVDLVYVPDIGGRVSAMAGPGEVLVSSTVKDLVVGSGLEFQDRGAHVLKGVPDEWRIFKVAP